MNKKSLLLFVLSFFALFSYFIMLPDKPTRQYQRIIDNIPLFKGLQKVDFSGIDALDWEEMKVLGPHENICELNLDLGEFSTLESCDPIGDTAYLLLIKGGKIVTRIHARALVHKKGQENSVSGKKGAVILFETDGRGELFQ